MTMYEAKLAARTIIGCLMDHQPHETVLLTDILLPAFLKKYG